MLTSVFAGGAGGAVSTNGDLNGAGMPGGPGFRQAAGFLVGGEGGSSAFGGGGIARVSALTGADGAAYGAGGSGAFAISGSGSVAGGAGVQGCWIVDEYAT